MNMLESTLSKTNIIDLEQSIFTYFNQAYQSYLNNISSVMFLNTFLEKIINLTESQSGFIASITNLDQINYLCIDTIYNKINELNEINLPLNAMLNIDQDSLLTISLKNNTVHIDNNLENYTFTYISFGGTHKGKQSHIKTIAMIPFSFNSQVRGIIVLLNRENYSKDMVSPLTTLGNLFGTLHCAYSKIKKTSFESDNRFITYQLLEEILDSITDSVIVTDNCYKIIFVNHKASDQICQITTNNNAVGLHITEIFTQLTAINNNQATLFRNKKLNIFARRHISGDLLYSSLSDASVELMFEATINSIICHNTIYHMFILKDISDKIDLDENLKKQNNFVAFLSHELRNPLQSIILSNHLLQLELKKINSAPKINNYMGIMNRSCEDMRKIISDILDLSKIHAKELSLDIEKCYVKEMIEQLVQTYSKDIQIFCIFQDNLPEIIYTDEVRLVQILSNLLTNAIKYTSNDISTKKVHMKISYDAKFIYFSVEDNGIGIHSEEINEIFKEFGKTSNNLKINCNSNGLGLCISQKMAQLLGGLIVVKSEYNKGSIFTLEHPLNLHNNNIIIGQKVQHMNIKGKILLVDDNSSNLLLLQLLMEHFNLELNYELEIHAVNSGFDAIQVCKINNYDIIFMDINMTGMDGCTACKLIKQNVSDRNQIYIIATTGNILAKQTIYSDNKYSCFDNVLIKPYDNDSILKILQEFLKN